MSEPSPFHQPYHTRRNVDPMGRPIDFFNAQGSTDSLPITPTPPVSPISFINKVLISSVLSEAYNFIYSPLRVPCPVSFTTTDSSRVSKTICQSTSFCVSFFSSSIQWFIFLDSWFTNRHSPSFIYRPTSSANASGSRSSPYYAEEASVAEG